MPALGHVDGDEAEERARVLGDIAQGLHHDGVVGFDDGARDQGAAEELVDVVGAVRQGPKVARVVVEEGGLRRDVEAVADVAAVELRGEGREERADLVRRVPGGGQGLQEEGFLADGVGSGGARVGQIGKPALP